MRGLSFMVRIDNRFVVHLMCTRAPAISQREKLMQRQHPPAAKVETFNGLAHFQATDNQLQ
jgi:hypothetical protein